MKLTLSVKRAVIHQSIERRETTGKGCLWSQTRIHVWKNVFQLGDKCLRTRRNKFEKESKPDYGGVNATSLQVCDRNLAGNSRLITDHIY